MTDEKIPRLVRTGDLPSYFRSNGIAFSAGGTLGLGFGHGNDQYHLYPYPGLANDETMGLFCEWHTEDFFDVDTGPHVAIGLRGPSMDEPHRGRGLAIGILAGQVPSPDGKDAVVPLFEGCPKWPGGPSFFVEDFSRNDGVAPVSQWQLSPGRHLPDLQSNGIYRIDIHVSASHVWAGVWKVMENASGDGGVSRRYIFMDQVSCSEDAPGFSGKQDSPCPQDPRDRGRGNAFIGTAFADPETRAWVDKIYIAHWKTPA